MDKYRFKPYSSEFPKMYNKEKVRLKRILSPSIKIEHVGSTSVPGLGGKGIIDIAIFTPKKYFNNYIKKLEQFGYEYKPHPGDDKRKFLQRIIKYKGKERRVHIHLTKEFWNSFIALRSYLRANKQAREKYSKLKKQGAKHSKGDGKKYMEYKIEFLKESVKKALDKENI